MARSTQSRDTDQEYTYFMGSEMLPSTYYILSEESSTPFYSKSNGYSYHSISETAAYVYISTLLWGFRGPAEKPLVIINQ